MGGLLTYGDCIGVFVPRSTVTTDEMIHQSDKMIQYLSWPSKAADLICLWRLKLNFNKQYLSSLVYLKISLSQEKKHGSSHGYMTKDGLKTKIRAITPIATKLSHFNCQGGPCPSGGPLGVTFWLKIENLCGNHIL